MASTALPGSQAKSEHVSACGHCPLSELQLAVLLGRSDPLSQPVWSEDWLYGGESGLSAEARDKYRILKQIYACLCQAAPEDSPGLANRWVFQPGVLEPMTDGSIMEYLLAEPSKQRFAEVLDILTETGSQPTAPPQ